MSEEKFQAMRQSIIDGAAITAAELARQAIAHRHRSHPSHRAGLRARRQPRGRAVRQAHDVFSRPRHGGRSHEVGAERSGARTGAARRDPPDAGYCRAGHGQRRHSRDRQVAGVDHADRGGFQGARPRRGCAVRQVCRARPGSWRGHRRHVGVANHHHAGPTQSD